MVSSDCLSLTFLLMVLLSKFLNDFTLFFDFFLKIAILTVLFHHFLFDLLALLQQGLLTFAFLLEFKLELTLLLSFLLLSFF